MALSGLGVLRFYQEKDPIKLWIPRNSDFIRDANWLKNQFREGYRLQSILITAPNVLEPQVLQKVGETTVTIDCTPCCAESAANFFSQSGEVTARTRRSIIVITAEIIVKELPEIPRPIVIAGPSLRPC